MARDSGFLQKFQQDFKYCKTYPRNSHGGPSVILKQGETWRG